MTKQIQLSLSPEQAAMLSHAIVEFQDNFNRQSYEDDSINEENLHDLSDLVNQILRQTKVEVFITVTPHFFENEE